MRTTVPPTAWSGPIRSPPRPKSTPKAHSATGWRLPIQWTHLILGHFSIPNGIVGGAGRIRFGIEIHHFSQPSNQELAPIEMCPPDRAAAGGVTIGVAGAAARVMAGF